jgi:hypothetical protein
LGRPEEKASSAQEGQAGVILYNPLRRKREALFERERFRSAFRQHGGRLLNLNEVAPHGGDTVCVHLQEFLSAHPTPPFF